MCGLGVIGRAEAASCCVCKVQSVPPWPDSVVGDPLVFVDHLQSSGHGAHFFFRTRQIQSCAGLHSLHLFKYLLLYMYMYWYQYVYKQAPIGFIGFFIALQSLEGFF